MPALSKSKILSYRQCPKRLWLEIKRPELLENSAATLASFNIGHQVGEIAQSIFDSEDKGVLVNPQRDGFGFAFDQTQELLGSFNPIFEAALTNGDALALADIMLPMNKRGKPKWRMIEVKSSTSVKDYHRDDVAVQAHIAKETGVNIERIDIACIDNAWVYPGKNNYEGLLNVTEVTDEAFARNDEVKGWIKDAHKVVSKKAEPHITTGPHCAAPYECGFYEYCTSKEPQAKFPVDWLPNVRKKDLKALIHEKGIIELKEIPDDLLNEQQLRVKKHSLSRKTFFDKKGARQDLSTHKLPVYFLDFETINLAVPIWKGKRPYQQVPFQYSLHKIDRNGALSHRSFLDLSGKDPAKPFAESLIDDCGKLGTIYVYNIGFESGRVRELAESYPRLKKSLLAINERMFDLFVIAKNRYYHPSQEGSWSIKKVLPTIAPDLRYDDLEGVQDGGMAMGAFSEAISVDTSSARKSEIKEQLFDYCKMDTVALVKLWRFFS